MTVFKINPDTITDWMAFHECFVKHFKFPDYYGYNLNAWIDCMSDVLAQTDGLLLLDFGEVYELKKRCPGMVTLILESCAFLNFRYTSVQQPPKLMVSLFA